MESESDQSGEDLLKEALNPFYKPEEQSEVVCGQQDNEGKTTVISDTEVDMSIHNDTVTETGHVHVLFIKNVFNDSCHDFMLS